METDRGNGQREGFRGRWELYFRALVNISKELASDIKHVRLAGEGREGQEGKGNLVMSLMSGKARNKNITKPVGERGQVLNLACTGRN